MQLLTIDYAIIVLYFVFVLGIGVALKRFVRTGLDFFLSGRSLATWITALAFISANLGAQEVIGMAASGAKYGILTSHFYWVGAIPAMVFVGVFMMPFYYGSRARSVPEYLRLRFDEKTRGFNAISFATMTAGTPARIAAANGARPDARRRGQGRVAAPPKSVLPVEPPRPGKCFTTGMTPAAVSPFAKASPSAVTVALEPPNDR